MRDIRISVVVDGGDRAVAEELARELVVPFDAERADYHLAVTAERLELREARSRAGPVFVDFSAAPTRGRRDALARAVGIKGTLTPTVIDATAGLGRDAFFLASLGARVTLLERSPVVAALLQDGLRRARSLPETADAASRMLFLIGDARQRLGKLPPPDVVYLDPMYPEKGKNAAKRKAMRFFRALVGDDEDADELLYAALETRAGRVVVKRPRKAEPLAGLTANSSLPGTTVRFDLYLPRRDNDAT